MKPRGSEIRTCIPGRRSAPTTTYPIQAMKLPIILLAALAAGPSVYSATFYTADFSGAVGSEWSSTTTSTTPTGARPFLGQFGNDTVTLNLSGLPSHNQIHLSVDLFLIRSWDGNSFSTPANQEHWKMSLGDSGSQSVRLDTTFSNASGQGQAYPDNFDGVSNHPRFTGSGEVNTLGYQDTPGIQGDSVYNLEFNVLHSASTFTVNFQGYGLQGFSDESWGITNVRLDYSSSPVPEPGEYAAAFGLGLAAFGAWRRRSRKVTSSAAQAA